MVVIKQLNPSRNSRKFILCQESVNFGSFCHTNLHKNRVTLADTKFIIDKPGFHGLRKFAGPVNRQCRYFDWITGSKTGVPDTIDIITENLDDVRL